LVGQDLSYGEDGETHVTEVPFSSEGENVFEVDGNYGKVKTNSGWYSFLKAFEYDVSLHTGEVINCTEGGALIRGVKIQNLEETIKDFETFNPLKIIKDNLVKPSPDDTEHLKGLIDKTVDEINCIINLCISGAAICKQYKQDLKTELTIKRLSQIRNEIIQPRLDIQKKYLNTFQLFLMHVIQSVHLKFEMEGAMMKDAKEVLSTFVDWYSFVGDICEICLQSLLKARDKIYAG